ncbi:MAG: hypothetical protein HKN13_07710, partial [Rhodothermales bacterium]|nr:hypothetical protein [Rhodothermales bacterium]
SVPYWIASRTGDQRARWYGDVLSRERDMWALLWHPNDVEPEADKEGLSVWHSALDWMVARTGYGVDDLVVAMRSGGPSNHEHADRNSLIVKWGGEILIADPYRPPYSFADPSWMMRTTAGHSGLLIDGNGHQYHDGSEGTNASDAVASIVRSGERNGYVYWASDASPAYRLVDDDVESVIRSVHVFEGMEATLVVDKVQKTNKASVLEARFFGDNRTDAGSHFSTESGGDTPQAGATGGCTISTEVMPGHAIADIARPLSAVRIASFSPSGISARVGKLPIPDENAALHPFASIVTTEASQSPMIVSLIVPFAGADIPTISIEQGKQGAVVIEASRGVNLLRLTVNDAGTLPEVIVHQTM